jgi:hypothetical protein
MLLYTVAAVNARQRYKEMIDLGVRARMLNKNYCEHILAAEWLLNNLACRCLKHASEGQCFI